MWRAFFLAMGAFLIILGLEALTVDKVYLRFRDAPATSPWPFNTTPKIGPNKQLSPPTWAPFSLLGAGAVVCLYSFTIPRRVNGE